MAKFVAAFLGAAGVLAAVACANGDLSSPEPIASPLNDNPDKAPDSGPGPSDEGTPIVHSYSVAGTVSGIVGRGLVVQNNGGDDISITGDGPFVFSQTIADGSKYDVTIKTQPNNPSQTCIVENGSGNITADVKNVAVKCAANKFTVGGKVTGLAGTGLVLQNNGGGDLTVNADGTFTFAVQQEDATTFDVTVKTQPTSVPAQSCVVTGGSGTIAGGNVDSILVNCSTSKFAISGTVNGLGGTGLVLKNNGGDDRNITANGQFSFLTPLDDGATYAVTIAGQPINKWQTCDVTNGTGTVNGGAVTSVVVNCTTNKFKVKANVTGLDGTGLVLQNNGGDDLSIPSDGVYEFATTIESGANYAVTRLTNPTNKVQTCTVGTGASGIMAGADVTVPVTCTTPGSNIVLNPGFEAGGANWQCAGKCGFDNTTFARTGTGNGYVRASDGWNDLHQTLTVLANTTYLVTAWIRTSNNNNNGYFGLRTQGGTVVGETKFTSFANYTQVSVTVNSGSNTSLVVYAGIHASADMWAQIDDVSVASQ